MQKNITRTARQSRPLTDAQKAVLPLRPLFDACRARGLAISDANRVQRLRAVNRYCARLGVRFNWVEYSFKELLDDEAQVFIVADAVQSGLLAW